MKGQKWFWVLGYLIAVIGLGNYAQQDQFLQSFGAYSFAFLFYLGLYYQRKQYTNREFKIILVLTGMLSLPFLPGLSPDYYRFLWDGKLILKGINPYAYTPDEIMQMQEFASDTYLQNLYAGTTQLSRENYSCYPSINQFYFVFANLFSENIWVNVMVMRLSILATMFIGLGFIEKILLQLNKDTFLASLLILNPFVVLELVINLHFEGVMMAFLAMAFYFLQRKKLVKSALFFAVAVNIKLTPILLLPFVYKDLNIKNTVKYYLYCGIGILVFTHLVLWPAYYDNFSQSLGLYFSNFEFNSSVYSLVYKALYPWFTWETVYIVGPTLSLVTLGVVVVYALRRKANKAEFFYGAMFFAYVIYLLLSSTVHPWYLTLPLFLGVFTRFRFVMMWSFVILLSYGFYAFDSPWIGEFLKWLEYGILLVCLVLDWKGLKSKKLL